jgi:hypothetical protein
MFRPEFYKVTSVKNTKCFKHWQAAQRRNQESESEIGMCDKMQMYNILTPCLKERTQMS